MMSRVSPTMTKIGLITVNARAPIRMLARLRIRRATRRL